MTGYYEEIENVLQAKKIQNRRGFQYFEDSDERSSEYSV
jgi:hypothetical protein